MEVPPWSGRSREKLTSHRKRIVPVLVALSLLSGLVVSLVSTPSALADYSIGCGYGYNSTGNIGGTGTGIQYGYGYLANGSFGYGYGNEVCPLAVTTASLAGGTVGTAYSQALAGTGGAGTYTWTETGALPGGLTLSTAGTLSGTPTAAGTFPFTVTMTDANAQVKTASLSLTIAPKSAPPKPKFHAIRVAGYAVVGRTVQMVIVAWASMETHISPVANAAPPCAPLMTTAACSSSRSRCAPGPHVAGTRSRFVWPTVQRPE